MLQQDRFTLSTNDVVNVNAVTFDSAMLENIIEFDVAQHCLFLWDWFVI